MKKTILTLLLAAMSTGAMAEWVRIGSNSERVTYADSSTIRKSGNFVKMWDLADLPSPVSLSRGQPFLSVKGQTEYDCADERYRLLAAIFHAESMGTGRVVYSEYPQTAWMPVPPGTLVAGTFQFACGK